MIYLVARSVPKVSELVTPQTKKNYLENFFKKIPWHKIDSVLNSLSMKFLRRLKVVIMKLDNFVSNYLNKFKSAENNKKEILSQDILENKSEKEENLN